MMTLRTHAAGAALLIAFAVALDRSPARAADAGAGTSDVVVHDAWARATPAGARVGALYLSIASVTGDRLVGAEVPRSVAAATDIHETVVVADSSGSEGSGRMTMRPVAFIELPPGETVELKPGGYHIMLLNLKKPLRVGARVPLTLVLEKAGRRKVTAVVRDE